MEAHETVSIQESYKFCERSSLIYKGVGGLLGGFYESLFTLYDYHLSMKLVRSCKLALIKAMKYDRLCGLVVRASGYRYRGLGFDSRRYQIFWVIVGLERGPLSLVRSIEELLE